MEEVFAGCCMYKALATTLATLPPSSFLRGGRHEANISCCPCCSGKFPPIPAHFSNDLKELVEALIKKEPEARPSLQEILDLAYVRRHMQLYRDHVARHITERQTSFQRSLSQFNLEAMAQVCFHPASHPVSTSLRLRGLQSGAGMLHL